MGMGYGVVNLRNEGYSLLAVMSELSTVRCDRVLSFLLQVHGCRWRAAVEVLWPMDRAVDSGEGQPGPELGPGGSCGVYSWIEGKAGFLVCATKPRRRTAVEDAKSSRHGRRSRD